MVWGNKTWVYSKPTALFLAQSNNSLSPNSAISPMVTYCSVGILLALAVAMVVACICQWCTTAKLCCQAKAMRKNSTNIELGKVLNP